MRPGRSLVPGALLALALLLTGCGAAPAPPAPAAPAAAPATGSAPVVTPADAATPVSVRIDAIGVESELDPMGIAADGSAEVPTDFGRVGWFTGSPPGPTVLLGHVDSTAGPAVFYELRDLGPGDEIVVTTADGGTRAYRVERTEQVPKAEFPTFAVFGASPEDVLRLVTCAGEFDRGERSYTDNLVVHAVRA